LAQALTAVQLESALCMQLMYIEYCGWCAVMQEVVIDAAV